MGPKIEVTVGAAREFFLRAMRNGYVSGAQPEKSSVLPGWKSISYREGDFNLVDMWHSAYDQIHSGGITMIYWKNNPVWAMHYGGWYIDEATPVLKAALKFNYENGIFLGGRGPMVFTNENFVYRNIPVNSDFKFFEGAEYINAIQIDVVAGTHWYKGGWLFMS